MYFQFPLLGFLLCIHKPRCASAVSEHGFQFPLLGFLLCIVGGIAITFQQYQATFNSLYWDFCSASSYPLKLTSRLWLWLSIPFIGIFALHPQPPPTTRPFKGGSLSIPFIGIFALHQPRSRTRQGCRAQAFQFPLLGFLLCICWHFLAGLPF